MTRRIATAAALILPATLMLTGCSGTGPDAVKDGQYAFLASSFNTGTSKGGRPDIATLSVHAPTLTLTQSTGQISLETIEPAQQAVLCPPSGQGRPTRLSTKIAIDGVTLTTPAIFGACPSNSPIRLTIVDLDSYDPNGGQLKYSRWVEFCNTSDADCVAR